MTNRMLRNELAFFLVVVLITKPAFAWDPWGDLQRPGKIIENAKREGNIVIRNVGDAVQKAAPVIATLSCLGCASLVNALPKDQQQLVQTIVEKGLVISTFGTIGGAYVLTVLDAQNGDVHKDDVPVQTTPPARVPNKYTIDFKTSACLAQFNDSGLIQLYAKAPPEFWAKLQGGDVITARADACPEYNSLQGVRNITSVVFEVTGASTNQLVEDGKGFKYLVVGKPAA